MPWEINRLIELSQSVVLDPNLANFYPILLVSIVNEFLSILPLGFIFASQLVFLRGPLSLDLFSKLFMFVALPVGIGVALGSLLIYYISYFGGKPAIDKFGKYFGLRWNDVERTKKRFNESSYDEILFLAMRCTPFFPNVPVTVAVGILRMHLFPFLVLTAFGTTVRIMLMMVMAAVGFTGLF